MALGLGFGLSIDLTAAEEAGFTDAKQALGVISKETIKSLGEGIDTKPEIVTKANEELDKALKGKAITLTMRIENIGKPQIQEVLRTRFLASKEIVRVSGLNFDVFATALLDVSENEKVAKITKGSRVTVTGKIGRTDINLIGGRGGKAGLPRFNFEVEDAKIK